MFSYLINFFLHLHKKRTKPIKSFAEMVATGKLSFSRDSTRTKMKNNDDDKQGLNTMIQDVNAINSSF